MRILRMVLLGTALAVGSAAAQGTSRALQRVDVAACDSGLHLLHLTVPPSSSDIRALFDSTRDSTIVTSAPVGIRLEEHPGIMMASGIMNVGGRPPTALAYLELDLLVRSAGPRGPAERQLTFTLQDSAKVRVAAYAFPSGAAASGYVDEHIVAMLSPDIATQVLRTRDLRGTLGTLPFEFDERQRDGLRAIAMYVVCGAKS